MQDIIHTRIQQGQSVFRDMHVGVGIHLHMHIHTKLTEKDRDKDRGVQGEACLEKYLLTTPKEQTDDSPQDKNA